QRAGEAGTQGRRGPVAPRGARAAAEEVAAAAGDDASAAGAHARRIPLRRHPRSGPASRRPGAKARRGEAFARDADVGEGAEPAQAQGRAVPFVPVLPGAIGLDPGQVEKWRALCCAPRLPEGLADSHDGALAFAACWLFV